MPELFVELFSEEIPARMQARAAEDLGSLLADALSPLSPTDRRVFYGPRRIACVAAVDASACSGAAFCASTA
jgi:glycyl-tRNA synthetase beta chain